MKKHIKQMKLIQPIKLVRTTNQFLQCSVTVKAVSYSKRLSHDINITVY